MCKTLIKHVSGDFRKWVQDDDDLGSRSKKLSIIRNLSSPDEGDVEMVTQARALLGGCLVKYAQGMPKSKSVKPYGLKASRSTTVFLGLPSTTFALTFAVIYQYVRTPEHVVAKWLKRPRTNITEPWNKGMIKRFTTLQKTFSENRAGVFKAFTDGGGEFMGEPPKKRSKKRADYVDLCDEDFE